jgi:adenylylsulfate kinase-like enzyme
MKLIVLYGAPASGKYTIAKLLSEKTGYKLFHNHLTVDLLKSVFDWGTPEFFRLSRKIRLDILEEAARQNIAGVVYTFVYEKDADDQFVRDFLEKVSNYGGEIKFIRIYCEKNELLKRVKAESRKQFLKVQTEEGLLKSLAGRDSMSPIPFVESAKIDNTHLTVEETFRKVLEALDINV